jgi:hypothetical protein
MSSRRLLSCEPTIGLGEGTTFQNENWAASKSLADMARSPGHVRLPPKADIAPNKTLSEFCGGRILTSTRTTGAHGLRLAARFLARYLVSSLSGKCRDLVGRWRDSPREKQRREVLSRSLFIADLV